MWPNLLCSLPVENGNKFCNPRQRKRSVHRPRSLRKIAWTIDWPVGSESDHGVRDASESKAKVRLVIYWDPFWPEFPRLLWVLTSFWMKMLSWDGLRWVEMSWDELRENNWINWRWLLLEVELRNRPLPPDSIGSSAWNWRLISLHARGWMRIGRRKILIFITVSAELPIEPIADIQKKIHQKNFTNRNSPSISVGVLDIIVICKLGNRAFQ